MLQQKHHGERRRRADAHWVIVSPTIKVSGGAYRVDAHRVNGPIQLRQFAVATSKGVHLHGQQQTRIPRYRSTWCG
jgi:hypothetical protein